MTGSRPDNPSGRRSPGLPRRTLLVGTVAAAALLAGSTPARAADARAGDLSFRVPSAVLPKTPSPPWQWYGEQSGGSLPVASVLARGDLQGASPQELQTALFAPQLTGNLPGLQFDTARLSTLVDTVQLRQPFSYEASHGVRHTGVALMISQGDRAGLLVVVGDSRVVTAGMIDGILGSARLTS